MFKQYGNPIDRMLYLKYSVLCLVKNKALTIKKSISKDLQIKHVKKFQRFRFIEIFSLQITLCIPLGQGP